MLFLFTAREDADKFEILYTRYRRLMLHRAYEILHDYSLAEDAVSEAYIRVYKNLHKVEQPESNKTAAFLLTIVRNAALTLLEKEKKTTASELEDTRPDSFDLEQSVVASLTEGEMIALVETLGEDLRQVFLLKYAYDMSHKEMAAILNTTENNVTVRLHRARRKLADLLRKEGYA